MTMAPGWTWSGCIKPVGTDELRAHLGVAPSGRLRITHDDGTVSRSGRDAYAIEPARR